MPPPPPLNGQDQQLSNILHFLQSEWRRYERDRNEWEVERAELRVRASPYMNTLVFTLFSHESLY
jgi:striatin 1/3/4